MVGLTENAAFAATPAEQVRILIAQAGSGPEKVHAVAAVYINVFGASHAASLENQLRLLVFDSVTATLWQALRTAASRPALPAGASC
jgi:maleate isomerase